MQSNEEQTPASISTLVSSVFTKHTAASMLIFSVAFIAALLFARYYYVWNHDDRLASTTINRSYHLPPLFAVAASLFWHPLIVARFTAVKSRVFYSGLVGSLAGAAVIVILGIEMAENIRLQYPEYWDWRRDAAEFAMIAAYGAFKCFLIGSAISIGHACYCHLRGCR